MGTAVAPGDEGGDEAIVPVAPIGGGLGESPGKAAGVLSSESGYAPSAGVAAFQSVSCQACTSQQDVIDSHMSPSYSDACMKHPRVWALNHNKMQYCTYNPHVTQYPHACKQWKLCFGCYRLL